MVFLVGPPAFPYSIHGVLHGYQQWLLGIGVATITLTQRVTKKNFKQLLVIHTVKGFDIVNKAEIGVFLELSRFFP